MTDEVVPDLDTLTTVTGTIVVDEPDITVMGAALPKLLTGEPPESRLPLASPVALLPFIGTEVWLSADKVDVQGLTAKLDELLCFDRPETDTDIASPVALDSFEMTAV